MAPRLWDVLFRKQPVERDSAFDEVNREQEQKLAEVGAATEKAVNAAQNLQATVEDLLEVNRKLRQARNIYWRNDGHPPK